MGNDMLNCKGDGGRQIGRKERYYLSLHFVCSRDHISKAIF